MSSERDPSFDAARAAARSVALCVALSVEWLD